MKAVKRILSLIVVLAIITFAGIAYLKFKTSKENDNHKYNAIATTAMHDNTYTEPYREDPGDKNTIKFDDKAARFADCTEEEILAAVAEHYYLKHGISDVLVRLDSVDGDIWLIQVYEDMGDHVNTFDWYTIDRVVASGTTMFGQENVDLSSLLNREPIYVYVEDSDELYDRHGYRADGSSIEYYTNSSYEIYDNNINDQLRDTVDDHETGTYVLTDGKYYVGYEDGQILPGTYGLRSEGNIDKYYATLKVQHKHSAGDYYSFGMAEGHDMLFNKGLLDFYVNEGDYIEYSENVGEHTITIYQK